MALRRIFRTNGVLIRAEDVGGSGNRTVTLEVSSGKVLVKSSGDEVREL
jgi:chemotaxis protein CheD